MSGRQQGCHFRPDALPLDTLKWPTGDGYRGRGWHIRPYCDSRSAAWNVQHNWQQYHCQIAARPIMGLDGEINGRPPPHWRPKRTMYPYQRRPGAGMTSWRVPGMGNETNKPLDSLHELPHAVHDSDSGGGQPTPPIDGNYQVITLFSPW